MASKPRSPHHTFMQIVFLVLAVAGIVMGSGPRQQPPQDGDAQPQVLPGPVPAFSAGAGRETAEAMAEVKRERAGAMAAGRSHSHSQFAFQTGGSHSAEASYSFKSGSSSYQSSRKMESSSSMKSDSSSGSSGGSSQQHGSSEDSGSAGSEVSSGEGRLSGRGSAAVNRDSRSSRARSVFSSAESASQHSHSADRQNAGQSSHRADRQNANGGRRRQDRPTPGGGQPQSDMQSSADVRSGGPQSSAAASSASSSRQDGRGRPSSAASRDMSELDRVSALASDLEQRNYFRQLFSRRCKDCTLNGQTYRGHSRFEHSEGCQRFRCICHCNGTHTCPPRYTMKVCQEGEQEAGGRAVAEARQRGDLRRRRCQTCEVLGQQFEGNAYFDVQDGCTKYRGCVCYCNGTWVCPSERAIDTCQQATAAPASACQACNAKGKVVAANSLFELEEPCRRYRHCRCHCNGTWECPPRFAQNTCQSPTPSPQEHPGCKSCSIPGNRRVAGNTYFQRKDGCTEFKNCVCRCNGSWTCPAQYARNVCAEAGSSQRYSRPHHLPANSAECLSCLAYGRYFRGNTYFSTRHGCLSYERCVCRCDGSWDCPNRYVMDLCRDEDPSNDVDNPNATCSFCDAEGKIVPPNSFFNLTKGCMQRWQCLCHCDGAWTCPERFSRNMCEQSPPRVSQKPEPERECNNCLLDSRVVRGNSYFDFTSACFRYRDCLCKCDGTYQCDEARAQNICNYSTTAAAASSSSSSSSSSLVVVTPASSCRRCLAFGQLHDWDTDFVHEEECVEYECRCHCNGSYTCPMDRARRTCQPGCRECEVGGQFFEGNTYFQHTDGCVVYLCTCLCNGSYSCPADRANNTCQDGRDSAPAAADVIAQGGGRRREECQQCVTNDGASHPPEEDFELQEGCIHYRCRCHCDGSWNCPGEDARNTCRGEVLGGCRSCVLSDSQIYRGGEEFQMRDGCIHYQCQCRCDGSWQCPGEQARDICLGEVPGGCRVCRVSRNETYRGGSVFQLRQGCYHYQCQCHCNGSWECPGETVRDVCIGEVPGGCRVCKLDSGEIYLGESDFQMVKNCIHYDCRCDCDGSWNCPGERARRVCNADGSPLREQPETTPQPPAPSCRRCVVSDEETFAPNKAFQLRRGCNVYQCDCQCDGSWNCPPNLATNICRRRDDPELRARTCASCRVSSYVYPGRSSFLLTRGCAQYSCQCDCRGRWTCDHRVARNICQDDRQGPLGSRARIRPGSGSRQVVHSVLSSVSSARSPQHAYNSLVSDISPRAVSTARGSSVAAANLGSFRARGRVSAPCRPCRVEGLDYTPNSDFVLEKKCKRFHCHCSCNGRWRCPRSRTEDTCDEDGYNVGGRRRTASAHIKPLPAGAAAEAQRYGRANIRVIGADMASSSSSSSSSSFGQTKREGDQGHGKLNVHGYYVNSQSQGAGNKRPGQQFYGQADNRRNGQQFYGQADNRQNGQQSLPEESSSAGGAMSVVEGGKEGKEAGDMCTPCRVDDRVFRTGAQFDWRRGCVIYKCSCLCSGSYRCRLSVDPDCREEEAPPGTGGIPTGPAMGGRPANQPGGSCGNCYVQGFVYPGNMSFTLRQGCLELSCHCRCDGNHECADQKPIPGCVAMSTPLGGAVYPHGAASSIYPLGGGVHGARPGRVINTFQQTYYSSCPSCAQGQAGPLLIPALLAPQQPSGQNQNAQQPSGQDRYPLAAQPPQEPDASAPVAYSQSPAGHHDQSASQYPVYHPQYPGNPQFLMSPQYPPNPQSPKQPQPGRAGLHSRTSVQRVPMQPVQAADKAMEDNQDDDMCALCFVNGQAQRGSFQYIKDCSHFTCHCDCSGRLHCAVRQAQTEECPIQSRRPPGSGECGSCMVQSQEYPPNLQFALRVGCYGYVCTCGCDGLWMCPRQQPTNYCVQPARPPTAVMDKGSDVLPMESGQGRTSQSHHIHPDGKAGLEDATYSRSAELQENSLLSCRDCEIKGTTYPSRTRFLLRDGCFQHTCDCACDGSWACAKALTVNVCQQGQVQDQVRQLQQQEEETPEEEEQGEEEEERRRSAHQRALAEVAAHRARLAAAHQECRDCQVQGDHFLPNAQFEFRQDCHLFTCHCFCNGSWSCPPSLTRNVCQGQDKPSRSLGRCQSCQWGNATYVGGSNFSHTEGCWQFDCHCGCNGQVMCPPNNSRDLCRAGDSHALRQRLSEENERLPLPLDCKPCLVDGQVIRSRTAFSRTEGCWEFLCQCECNGTWTCPPDRSLNTCHLHAVSPPPSPPDPARPPAPKGCKVGRKTYFTRLFAYRDGCVQHMCICYDNGGWRCPPGKERRLC